MNIFFKLVKRLCIGMFSIYSINVLFSTLNIIIPVNVYTIAVSSFLGIFGVIALIVIDLVI